MLRHRGTSRTYTHNLRLAAMLSFVAGTVNICGVLATGILTTNVTGHFAFFAEELVQSRYDPAFSFLIYILSFLAGSFTSSFLSELVYTRRPEYAHILPMVTEISLLLFASLCLGPALGAVSPMACALLFAMGIQNSLVTSVSNSIVRTTHLTGLFTDLGIELSQLFFFRTAADRKRLRKSMLLRTVIILCFFLGGITGGYLYIKNTSAALQFAAGFLVVALVYDTVRYRLYYLARKMKSN